MKQQLIDTQAIAAYQKRAKRPLPDNSVYHQVVQPLLERLDYIRLQPRLILNIGWRNEITHDLLSMRYPSATIMDVTTMAALSTLEAHSVDMVVLHFSLYLENQPIELLTQLHRVLREEGLLLLAECGPDTFQELRYAFSQVMLNPVHTFFDMHHVGDWLRGLQFSDPVMDCETLVFLYNDTKTLFKEIKDIGLMNAAITRQRGLLSRLKWQQVLAQYGNIKHENDFPVTGEVIYGHGWKVKIKLPTDEFYIPVEAILKR